MKIRKNRMVSILLAMVLVLSFAGCGNTIPAVNEKDSEKMTEEVTEIVEDDASLEESIADAGEPVEQSTKVDKPAETITEKTETAKTETAQTVQNHTSAQTSTSAQTPAPAQTSAPAQSAQQTTEPAAPAQSSAPAATPTPEPVHEHTWKEHVATNQVWVPNVVVVDDYEEHTVEAYMFYCSCGFETDNRDVISNHVKESIRANDGQAHNFTIHNNSYTEQVKVGSHEEDQGHYDTSSYVDYYYCDCGATK